MTASKIYSEMAYVVAFFVWFIVAESEALSLTASQKQSIVLPEINIRVKAKLAADPYPKGIQISNSLKDRRGLSSSDTADLFRNQPGISSYRAGGVASLPIINGLGVERVITEVDGVRIAAACPNDMNPTLSYVQPGEVQSATVIAGITPVSMGGDSLTGVISVERRQPVYASRGERLISGSSQTFYRSNGDGLGASGNFSVSNDHLSLGYSASWSQSHDVTGGRNVGVIRSTEYKTYNHVVTGGWRKDSRSVVLMFGQQVTPYEGFPNQYMDMTNNRSTYVNGNYEGDFDWGHLLAQGYWQRTKHIMNMLKDKGGHTATTGMPMNADSRQVGYKIKFSLPLTNRRTMRLGSEFIHEGLNDWWPPLAGRVMMGPNTYHNINGGHRDRLGHFVEWQERWISDFSTLLGIRNDIVWMNTSDVAPYNSMDTTMMPNPDEKAAKIFNASKRGRTDSNFSVTAMADWQVSPNFTVEGGYARKNRSPNLYERYSWGRGAMAATMIGWFGDGNGYVGNLALKPETANTFSATLAWHDPADEIWQLKLQPYYNYVQDYINVEKVGVLSSTSHEMGTSEHITSPQIPLLQFINHNAELYGVNVNGQYVFWNVEENKKRGIVHAQLNWVRGTDLTSHSGLYHMMPINGSIDLTKDFGFFSGWIEVVMALSKTRIDTMRGEGRTPAYTFFNLGGSYEWMRLKLNVGLDNVLDQKYILPLAGWADVRTWKRTGRLTPYYGTGRSVNVSLTASF